MRRKDHGGSKGILRIQRHTSFCPYGRIEIRLHLKSLLRKRTQPQQGIRVEVEYRRIRVSTVQTPRVLQLEMRLFGIGRQPVRIEFVRVGTPDFRVVLQIKHRTERTKAHGCFDSEICLIGQRSCSIVGRKLRGDVKAIANEVICVTLKEGAVCVCPGGRIYSFRISVGKNEDVACFFDRLLFRFAVIMASSIGVGGADVVDGPRLRKGSAWIENRGKRKTKKMGSRGDWGLTEGQRPASRYRTTGSSTRRIYSGAIT